MSYNDKYTECPDCGHHRSVHNNYDSSNCDYGTNCECTTSQKEVDAHIATFDTRTCELCGLGKVTNSSSGNAWSHGGVQHCMHAMGKKIKEMEREMFSRRAAIRDQKEKRNGK